MESLFGAGCFRKLCVHVAKCLEVVQFNSYPLSAIQLFRCVICACEPACATFASLLKPLSVLRGLQVFFGKQGLINHVGICVQAAGEDMPLRYMHCSSSTHGRDGIGSDDLHISSDTIGAHYARAFVSIGRVHAKVVTEEHIGVLTRTTE